MTRILLITAILVAALSISAFAADDTDNATVSLTVAKYIDITNGGNASGSVTGTDYTAGQIVLTNSGSGNVNVVSNATYSVKAKISSYSGSEFGSAPLYFSLDNGTTYFELIGTDTTIVSGQAATNSQNFSQKFRVGDASVTAKKLTPAGTPYSVGGYSATVVLTASN